MRLFLDSADLAEVRRVAELGICDGVTTNPTLIAKAGMDFKKVVVDIADLIDGPISAEVVSEDFDGMVREAELIKSLHRNIVIKLPLTPDGLRVCKKLTNEGIKTNVTLCFQAGQALLAAKCGATYISPFVGRLDDVSVDGMSLVREIRTIYNNFGFSTQILVASVRHPRHVIEAALVGADVVTAPFKVLSQLYHHPLTEKGLAAFLSDWHASGQKSII